MKVFSAQESGPYWCETEITAGRPVGDVGGDKTDNLSAPQSEHYWGEQRAELAGLQGVGGDKTDTMVDKKKHWTALNIKTCRRTWT